MWNVLSHYDIPEAAACIAPRALRLISPLDHQCEPLDFSELQAVYKPAYTAYHSADAETCLEIEKTGKLSTLDWLKLTLPQE
jgi:hypothetical protein